MVELKLGSTASACKVCLRNRTGKKKAKQKTKEKREKKSERRHNLPLIPAAPATPHKNQALSSPFLFRIQFY
jgi:hypothetical protein